MCYCGCSSSPSWTLFWCWERWQIPWARTPSTRLYWSRLRVPSPMHGGMARQARSHQAYKVIPLGFRSATPTQKRWWCHHPSPGTRCSSSSIVALSPVLKKSPQSIWAVFTGSSCKESGTLVEGTEFREAVLQPGAQIWVSIQLLSLRGTCATFVISLSPFSLRANIRCMLLVN